MKNLQLHCPENEGNEPAPLPAPLNDMNQLNAQAAWGHSPVSKASAVWGKSVWLLVSHSIPVSSWGPGAR